MAHNDLKVIIFVNVYGTTDFLNFKPCELQDHIGSLKMWEFIK